MATWFTLLRTWNNLKILHITDIHYDPLYSTNSPTNCFLGNTGLGCCHKYDIPLKNSGKASKWGDYNCDLSYTFLDSTFKWIQKEFYNTTQFIIYTGDSAGHHDFSNSLSVCEKIIKGNLIDKIKENINDIY